VLGRERVEREQVGLGVGEQLGDLRGGRRELLDHRADALARLRLVVGVEDLAQRGRHERALRRPAVLVHVPDEMDRAALPWAAEHAGDGVLEALVRVADAQADAVEAAAAERAQELAPERLGLDLADVEADHLAPARFVHAVGDHDRLGTDVRAVADLLLLGIEPQVRVGALQRPLAEHLDLLIQAPAQPRHLVLGHAHPELLDHPVDLAGRDAVDVGLLDDGDQRLLGAPPRLQEAREVPRARPQLRDRELDRAHARVPLARPVAVALGRPTLRGALAELRADHRRHLSLHQRVDHEPHRLADHVGVLRTHHLVDRVRSRHPAVLGHRGASPSSVASQ
jgi:hypothetical protein